MSVRPSTAKAVGMLRMRNLKAGDIKLEIPQTGSPSTCNIKKEEKEKQLLRPPPVREAHLGPGGERKRREDTGKLIGGRRGGERNEKLN